eukprot:TRINITY_DN22494_c0_g1_i1.p1 TRINITY_DN22494_c0_g1~~TRINITY_DN22494_c0_g1_i1.p1  ORF type:complete len:202 (-),score=33.32 TRINITY_DN22494_c0_g1_i1:76-681(-)
MSRRVYVGGIPNEMSLEDIKQEIMTQTRGVQDVVVVMGEQAKNKGIAFITYSSVEMAETAIRTSVVLGNKKVTMSITENDGKEKRLAEAADGQLKRAKVEESTQNTSKVLLVSGYPSDVTENDLKVLFEVHGEVNKIELHHEPNKPPFSLVYMLHQYCASRAKRELADNLWKGNSLRVEYTYEDLPDNPVTTNTVTVALVC